MSPDPSAELMRLINGFQVSQAIHVAASGSTTPALVHAGAQLSSLHKTVLAVNQCSFVKATPDKVTGWPQHSLALQLGFFRSPPRARCFFSGPPFLNANRRWSWDCQQWKCLQSAHAFRPSPLRSHAKGVRRLVHCRTWFPPTCARGPSRRSFGRSGQRALRATMPCREN
jgi:hypothetical protein